MSGAGRLGIDFGTSNTVAVLANPGAAARPLLFDGSPQLRSAVCLDTAGRLVAGQDALHLALALPESFEPHPKRCIDDGQVLLGDRTVAVPDLIAAVLRRVVQEVGAVPPGEVVLTYPAAWGSGRRGALLAGASQVLPAVRLVPEPVAAASYFAHVVGHQVPPAGHAVVFDLGAGTFDVSLLRNTPVGFEVVASEGLPDAGGLDIDAAVVAHIERAIADRDRAAWSRLTRPQTASDRRANRLLWSNVEAGKQMLARTSFTMIHVPLLDTEIALGREELDALAAPIIARTVATTRDTLRHAGVPESGLASVFLVGGGSRMPAVATALHRALGLVPTVVQQPELAVAEGSLLVPVPSAGGARREGGSWSAVSPLAAATGQPAAPTAAGPVSAAPAAGLPVSGAPLPGSPVSGPPVPDTPATPAHPVPAPWSPPAPAPILPGPISSGPISPAPILPGPISPGPISPGPAAPGPAAPAAASAPPVPLWPAAPARAPRPTGRRWPWLAVAAAVVVIIGIAAAIAWTGVGRPERSPSVAGGSSTKPRPSAAPSPSPSASPVPPSPVDPCLVGTWRSTHIQQLHVLNGQQVEMTGRAGVLATYYPDGRFRTDYNHSTPLRARYQGAVWTEIARGVATGSVHDEGGVEYLTEVHASGSVTLYRNGRRNNAIELNLTGDPTTYFCSGDKATFDSPGYVSSWARVPSAPSAGPASSPPPDGS